MKTVVTFLWIVSLFVCAWTIPVLNKPDLVPLEPGIVLLNICPIPMCMQIQGPCDNLQISYMTVNGKKCPMCPYCATSTVDR